MDEELRATVGRRVRRLRTQHGRSVREQARRIGVSPALLSQLENNRGGISLQRLQRVAEDLGVHITDLFADTAAQHNGQPRIEIFQNSLVALPGVKRGKGAFYQLVGSGTEHVLQPYLLSFEPGGTFEGDAIGHPGEEFAYVLHGEVELLLDGKIHRIGQGDAVRFNTEPPHAFRNASSTAVALVVGAATPPW